MPVITCTQSPALVKPRTLTATNAIVRTSPPKKTKRMSAEGAFTKDASIQKPTKTRIVLAEPGKVRVARWDAGNAAEKQKIDQQVSKRRLQSPLGHVPRQSMSQLPMPHSWLTVSILLTAGLVEDGNTFGLPDDSIPNKAEIQTLVNRGVAYYKPNGRGITISPMRYFEEAGDIKFTDDEGNSVMCSNTFFNSHGIPQKKSGETVIQKPGAQKAIATITHTFNPTGQ
ncbi:hypothetical protein R3P38DRAFT_2775700 [Favolaschia claudopus]|uniref:Uncharacterized protein n=1 Tax=Favolaschia claudopus TaxID=2862362 RepID=A0AAW0BUG2_9AGAR